MRKSLLFGAVLLIASCTVYKEEEFENPAQHRYHAVVEEPVDAETRVFTDSKLRVRWNEGDHISIFERNTYNQEFEFLGDTGDTAGDFDPVEGSGYHSSGDIEDGNVYAVYPYEKKNKCDFDGKLTVTFPSVQHYKKDSFGVGANVMVAKTNTMDLRFMHVGGYRTFKLYGEGVFVSSVRIESNGPEYLSGRTDVTIGEDGKPAVSFIESTSNSKTVELVCDTPVALGATDAEAVEFWFVLPPGTLTQGFTVTITDENGNEFTKSTSNSIEVKSGVKKSMPAFEVDLVTTQTTGTLSGHDWVDMGNGLKWATMNLGADSETDYGDYYSWGETFTKSDYKYNNYSYTGNSLTLPSTHDVSSMEWGSDWRMPTKKDWDWLLNTANCTSEWVTDYQGSGRNGCLFTSMSNGNQLFLPAADAGFDDGISDRGTYCYYWSSSLSQSNSSRAWCMNYWAGQNEGDMWMLEFPRYLGNSVRPVSGPESIPGIESDHAWVDMGSGLKWATMNLGADSEADYGNYYSWGEIITKSEYSSVTYSYTGNPFSLPSARDAAFVEWGSLWRMPTDHDIRWLMDSANCTNEWVTDYQGSGKNGCLITSVINGNQLFFPAAGNRKGTELLYAGNRGEYGTSRLDESDHSCASQLCFGFGSNNSIIIVNPNLAEGLLSRFIGRTIRPVSDY